MGCCMSSDITTQPQKFSPLQEKPLESKGTSFQVEEEKVKEVLSETPKLNPKTTLKSKPQKPHQNNIKAFEEFREEENKVKKKKKKALPIYKGEDFSEVCSLSETISTSTTTTITSQREREEAGKRVNKSPAKLHKNRSFSGDVTGRRERKVNVPTNVIGSVRLVQCRDHQPGQKMGNGGTRRRRDPGDNSFRRSRSPATGSDASAARPVMGRSPSARRTNQSPVSRVRTTPPEKGRRKMENPAMVGKRRSTNESLENPLVSLECFIFI